MIVFEKENSAFFASVCALAIPAALQSMLQSSFSIVDQLMIGRLGSVSVAGVGLASKFAGIYGVIASAMGAVAGIMISQYIGQKNDGEVRRSLAVNLLLALAIGVLVTLVCLLCPRQIMGLYTRDAQTLSAAADYLRIVCAASLPLACATLLTTLFRCIEKARWPLCASIAAALVNTALNYVLIFGKLGMPALGMRGAAIATVIAQLVNMLTMLVIFALHRRSLPLARPTVRLPKFNWKQYGAILLPMLVCEVVWSLGENVYAAVYGHLGTDACAAMTLTNPVQGLMIGALCGLSQAAGVLVGKRLGENRPDLAYAHAKRLMVYGFAGALALSVLIVSCSGAYVRLYNVTDGVRALTRQILFAYALVAPFKIQNMILGGGILRSGGRTQYVMVIDMAGTWVFGVPLALLSAFVLKLPIPCVYFILSLEECVRFAISLAIFKSRRWMTMLRAG